ncbi:MAG TPA: hypothetical protein VK738_13305 [Terriglobales bacterium]|jgi:hypothetical protein|nr:hypothetical protein [Terriglobales bacterium]
MKITELFGGGRRCQHVFQNGDQCKATPQKDKAYCFFHDPEQQQKRSAARRQGGAAGRRARAEIVLPADGPVKPLKEVAQLEELMEETIHKVQRGEIDPYVATTICYLANSLYVFKQRNAAHASKAKEEKVFQRRPDGSIIFGPKPEFEEDA